MTQATTSLIKNERTHKTEPMKMRNKLLAAGAGAAAAAAGYYFYYHKNAKKNRATAAKWVTDFKDDVMRQAQQVKNIDKAALVGIVDGVAKAYEGIRSLDRKDVMRAADELKNNWLKLRDELKKTGAAAGKEAQKTLHEATRSARKTTKKVTSKVRKSMR
jgi:DNA-directed RNA polymerase beta' subunit